MNTPHKGLVARYPGLLEGLPLNKNGKSDKAGHGILIPMFFLSAGTGAGIAGGYLLTTTYGILGAMLGSIGAFAVATIVVLGMKLKNL